MASPGIEPQVVLPRRPKGRPSRGSTEAYRLQVVAFCAAIMELRSSIGFSPSARGWCYVLEDRAGLLKGEFDAAQRVINDCRKLGALPLDITGEDIARETLGAEEVHNEDPDEYADLLIRGCVGAIETRYTPISFWDDLDVYVEMMVEKIDLRSLFAPVCERYHVPLTNVRGWADMHSRAALMRRMQQWDEWGRQCILLYCGDHDPGGLHISDTLLTNLQDMQHAVGWDPSGIEVVRFGLDYDFIEEHGLSWIDNLETSSGDRLNDPEHNDYGKPYVQDYIRRFGPRKVEANALVVRPEEGRELCRSAIEQYISPEDLKRYDAKLKPIRAEALAAFREAARRYAEEDEL